MPRPTDTAAKSVYFTRGLADLLELRQEAERLEGLQADLVRDMVLAGISWATIGTVLGVTRQAVRQRYGRHVDAWRAAHGDLMPWDDVGHG